LRIDAATNTAEQLDVPFPKEMEQMRMTGPAICKAPVLCPQHNMEIGSTRYINVKNSHFNAFLFMAFRMVLFGSRCLATTMHW
jgi:hypothetical protein